MTIITTDLTLLARQDSETDLRSRVEETYRDPHGNVVRFSVGLARTPRDKCFDTAQAEILVEGRWEPLTKMFYENLPEKTGDAMMWLLATAGAILGWPDAPVLPVEV